MIPCEACRNLIARRSYRKLLRSLEFMSDYTVRQEKLRRALAGQHASALLVTRFTNVTYLTGFSGDDSFLLVTPDNVVLITDFRFETQLEDECPGLDLYVRKQGEQMFQAIAKVVKAAGLSQLAIDAESMTVGLREQIAKELPKVSMPSTSGLIELLREVKDKEEIGQIRRAAAIAEKALAIVRHTMLPERSERQVAAELDYQMRQLGAKGSAFETIIATGARAALPHARPGEQTIGSGEFTLVDWGATAGMYRSDLTRLVVTSKISPKLKRVYGVVLEAQRQAIAAIRPGVPACDVDRTAREVISQAGLGRYFGHSLGHGIGLDIHEGPRLIKTNKRPLKPGNVVTVEPGIYLAGWGGVRIEDDVLVTRHGCEVLTRFPKELEESVVA